MIMLKYEITAVNKWALTDDCKTKWLGKKITLLELPTLIADTIFPVIFDGKTINIYNDYNE